MSQTEPCLHRVELMSYVCAECNEPFWACPRCMNRSLREGAEPVPICRDCWIEKEVQDHIAVQDAECPY